MRVCLYTESALPLMGGQELVVDALARRFAERGDQVVVLAPRPGRHLRLADQDLPYDVVRHPRFISTRRYLGWYTRYLARIHRKYPFDILHCHSVYPTGYVATRCRAVADVRLVITSHCGDVVPSSPLLRKPGVRQRSVLALQRADAAIAISDFAHEWLRALCPNIRHIARIPNGVELERYATPIPRPEGLDAAIQSKRYFLFTGRLVQRKGVDLLLESFAGASQVGRHNVVLGGTGREESSLRRQAAELRIQDRVVFAGNIEGDTKTWLLQNALCTVIPSRISEGFPLVFLESCAAGRPVIGTRIPGLLGLIQPGETGLLVPPNSVEAVQWALTLMSCNPELRERMGKNALAAANRYDWCSIVNAHLALYRELLDSDRASKAA